MTTNAVRVTIELEYSDLPESEVEDRVYADLQECMQTTDLKYWAKIQIDNYEKENN